MKFIDSFYVELAQTLRFGLFLFFALLAIVFILGCIISFVEWINRRFFIHRFVFGKKGAGKERIDK